MAGLQDTADTRSRVYDTKLGGFHQLIALNQGYINESFEAMWKNADKKDPIKYMDESFFPAGEFKKCELLAPLVELLVEHNDYNYLNYSVRFKSGSIKLWYRESGQSKDRTFDVKDWVFVFRIMIGVKPVDRDSEEFKELAKRVDPIIKDFSLTKLWLDSTKIEINAQLQAKSYFGGVDWSKEPSSLKTSFNFLITTWASECAEAGKTLLGVVVDTEQSPQVIEATFPPTSLAKENYAWQNPATRPVPPVKDGLKENMLLYLMMSQKVNPPTPAHLNYGNGMWNDNSAGNHGTFVMSKHLFWDKWLLSILQRCNKAGQIYTTKPYAYAKNYWTWDYDFWWLFGQNPLPWDNSYFKFNETVKDDKPSWSWGPGRDKADLYQRSSDGSRLVFEVVCQMWTWADHTINFVPGQNQIEVVGWQKGQQVLDLNGEAVSIYDRPCWMNLEIWIEWKFIIEIKTISGGGLNFELVDKLYPENKDYQVTTYFNDDHWIYEYPWVVRKFDTERDQVLEKLNTSVPGILDTMKADLLHQMNMQQKLYLPGAGNFFFKDPVFNNRGDLLVNVVYDGFASTNHGAEAASHQHRLEQRRTAQAAAGKQKADFDAKIQGEVNRSRQPVESLSDRPSKPSAPSVDCNPSTDEDIYRRNKLRQLPNSDRPTPEHDVGLDRLKRVGTKSEQSV